MIDLMLDFETWGNTSNSVIIQIGACCFDRYTGNIGKTFIKNVDPDDGIKNGFEITASTLIWWMNQEKDAILSSIKKPQYPVKKVITMFNNFISKNKIKFIWSHATFDFVILMNHFNKLNIVPNFNYRSARDLRTLVDLANIKVKNYERAGIHHNALDDCLFQVKYARDCFNKLKSKGKENEKEDH